MAAEAVDLDLAFPQPRNAPLRKSGARMRRRADLVYLGDARLHA
jgi:hypothetical protein